MPVVVLAGDSELSKDERVEQLKGEFDGDYLRVQPDDPEKLELINEVLRSVGMFSRKRIVDVLDFDSWKAKERRSLLSNLDSVPEDVLLVIRASKSIKGLKSEVFSLPKAWERDKWRELVGKEFEKRGLKASDEVLEYFLDVVGPDEYRVRSEVEKLSLYKTGEISPADIDEVVHAYEHSSIDDLCFSISEMRYEDAHGMVNEILRNFNPVLVVGSISKHFVDLYRLRSVAKVKERYIWPDVSKLSKELSIPLPKVARFLGFSFKGWRFKPVNHMKIYDLKSLSSILKRLYILDRDFKGGADPRISLHEFLEYVRRDVDVRHSGEVDIG